MYIHVATAIRLSQPTAMVNILLVIIIPLTHFVFETHTNEGNMDGISQILQATWFHEVHIYFTSCSDLV